MHTLLSFEFLDQQTIGQLGWAIGQASLIAAAAYALVILAGRVKPAARVHISLLGLILMAIVPVAALSQSAGWSWGQLFPIVDSDVSNLVSTETSLDASSPHSLDIQPPSAWQNILINTSEAFIQRVDPTQATAASGSIPLAEKQPISSLPTILVSMLSLCIAYGLIRIAVGYWQLKGLRASSVPVQHQDLDALLAECVQQLNLKSSPAVAETQRLNSAAIIGWRNPLLLLPIGWQAWTTEERRAVVSHELAHVKRRDFLSTALGQLALAVNFYHPLAHIVLERLRLDQELAADAMAAQTVGGQQRYVELLAGLALRQPKVRTPGPSQAFLPPRRMFVRRLEMLRTLPNSALWLNRCYSAVATLTLVAVATMATGLRSHLVIAQEQHPAAGSSEDLDVKAATNTRQSRPLASYIPDGLCDTIILVDVQALLNTAAFAQLKQLVAIPETIETLGPGNLLLNEIQAVVIGQAAQQAAGSIEGELVLIRTTKDLAEKDLPTRVRRLSPRTFAVCSQPKILALLQPGLSNPAWAALLSPNHAAQIRLGCNTNFIRQIAELGGPGGPGMAFSPLWQNVENWTANIAISDGIAINVQADANDPKKVADTLGALRLLARNYLEKMPEMIQQPGSSARDTVLAKIASNYGGQLLTNLEIQAEEKFVTLTGQLEEATQPFVAALAPVVEASRMSAHRQLSMNKMKYLGLAIHHYESKYAQLPTAVIIDKASGAKRSWRVELLPFLDQQKLYDQYRKDEPWDSPSNKLVLEQIPHVFEGTGSIGTQDTPYQAIVSEGGGLTLTDSGKAPSVADITDGLANTIFLVETKLVVPWTKPIDLEATDETPKLGTARASDPVILVAMGDGSVHVISESMVTDVWRALTTRAGGETGIRP